MSVTEHLPINVFRLGLVKSVALQVMPLSHRLRGVELDKCTSPHGVKLCLTVIALWRIAVSNRRNGQL